MARCPIPFLLVLAWLRNVHLETTFSSLPRRERGKTWAEESVSEQVGAFLDCTLEWELFAHRFLFPLPGGLGSFSEDDELASVMQIGTT